MLVVHNRYRSGAPGGEDVLVDAECRLLESAGHEVVRYERSNDEVDAGKLSHLVSTASQIRRSSRTEQELRRLVSRCQPDIAHCHNLFPLITSSAFDVLSEAKIPAVQTLHNYRLTCASAIHYRNGRECRACTAKNTIPALFHGCYGNSRLASAAVAAMIWSNHRDGTTRQKVSRYLVLTEFAKNWLASQGISQSLITVRPNWVDVPNRSNRLPSDYVVFSGRLSEEKGLRVLVSAWEHLRHVPLKIVGDGPLRAELESQARQAALPIEFLGSLTRERALEVVAAAKALVLPSLWYEGMPLVILEAWALGTPVIASRIGGLAEMIGKDSRGLLFEPGDSVALATAVNRLLSDQQSVDSMVAEARLQYLRRHTPAEGLKQLIANYEACLLRSSRS